MSTNSDRYQNLFIHFMKGLFTCFFTILFCFLTIAQEINKKSGLVKGNPYSDDKNNKRKFGNLGGEAAEGSMSTRWSFGIKGGINMTTANADDQFSVFSYTEEPANTITEKVYFKSTDNKGFQVTFITKYAIFNGISIAMQPTFANYTYGYENYYSWVDFENSNNSLFLHYTHEQELNYIELPLVIRYDVMFSPIRPFVQGGAYYGFMLNALKKVEVTGEDLASGGAEEFNGGTSTLGIDDQFNKGQYGIIAGGGISFNMGPANLELGVDYRFGMNRIVNENNRYADNTLISGSYDVLDNVSLRNLSISLGIVFGI